MAKIENYSNDTDITNNDRLFGTSVNGPDSETANFKVGELKTFINTGYATTAEVATAKAEAIAAAAADTNTKVANNLTLIQSNDTDIATNTANIATNTSNISTNTTNISTNTSNISTNTTNIAAITPAYQAYTQAAIEQKFALRSEEINIDGSNNATNDNINIRFSDMGDDPGGRSLKYDIDANDNLALIYSDDIGYDHIQNGSLVTVPVKISFSMFTTTGSSSTNLIYRIEKSSDDGVSWTEEKKIIRSKSGSSSNNSDSFFLYYGIAAGNYIRFTFQANHTGTILQAGSWIEVVAINPQT